MWGRREGSSRVSIAPQMSSIRITMSRAANEPWVHRLAPNAWGTEGRSSGTRENRVESAPHRGSSHPWRTCAWGRRCACGGWKRVVIAVRTRVHELIDPNDSRTRLRDPRNAPRRDVPGRGRGRGFTHPCTGGSSAAFSVILDMATETRDATPTRGEESARVGRNGLKIRPRARIREWATRRVRCTATRRVVFALVRLLADTRKSPGLESSEVRNSLVFESPQTSRWSCGV